MVDFAIIVAEELSVQILTNSYPNETLRTVVGVEGV